MMELPPVFLERPIAHRTLHDRALGRPENSRAGIRAAIDAGYGIEIDVQLSSDGAAMVFHDYGLDRLTGTAGPLRLRDRSELHAIGLTGGNETIPDLPEVLDLVAGQVPILLEIKDQDGAMGPDIGPLEEDVARALSAYHGPLAVMSFNPHSVELMGRLCPDRPRGLVTCGYNSEDWPLSDNICDRLRSIPDYDRVGASFISHDVKDLQNPRVSALKVAGANVLCWTVRSKAEAEVALQVAENITFEGFLP